MRGLVLGYLPSLLSVVLLSIVFNTSLFWANYALFVHVETQHGIFLAKTRFKISPSPITDEAQKGQYKKNQVTDD